MTRPETRSWSIPASPRMTGTRWPVGGSGEVAAHLERPTWSRQAYHDLLAPMTGWSVNAGAGTASARRRLPGTGPHSHRGTPELASRHADDAEHLMDQWQIPPVRQWFAGERDRFGF